MCFLVLLPTYSQKCFLCLKNSDANSTSVNTKNAIQQAVQGGVNTPMEGGAPLPKPQEKAWDPLASLRAFSFTICPASMNQEFRSCVSSCPPRQNQEGSLVDSTSYSSGVQAKGKASRPHTRVHRRCPARPRHVWALGPGRAVKRGPKSSQDMCRAPARRVEASPPQTVAMTARCQVLLQGRVNVRGPHLKLGLSPDS